MIDATPLEGTLYFATVANVGLYQLPEMNTILRVYMAGTPLSSTSIDTLEGNQLGVYDSSAANSQPQWATAIPIAYPQANTPQYAPIPRGLPWTMNWPIPMYYMRGPGAIGFVPAPANVVTVQIDWQPEPNPLVNLTDVDILPDKAVNAICYMTIAYMCAADGNAEGFAQNMLGYGGQNGTGGAIGQLLTWKRDRQPKLKPVGPLFVTARTRWSGPPRVGTGAGRYGN